ncbi:preprotein translocase subunit SecG, partial [Cereibacter changlensis]
MENVVLTVHLILALLLVGIVLVQRSEGGGLGMGGGGGGAMSGRAAANVMTRLTWILAAAFIGTSITLTIFAARDSAGTSVIDQIGGSAPAPATTEAPLGTDLLPPAPTNAPLTPPRADDAAVPAT